MRTYNTDNIREWITTLDAGDEFLLTGTILVARDAVHKKLAELIKAGKPLPEDIQNKIIYYCGPTPLTDDGRVLSAGPTTSSRMDVYTPELMEKFGLAATIGKGQRSDEVTEAIVRCKGAYFITYGGFGAVIADRIKKCEVLAFAELGCEALMRMTVESFPLIVGVDSRGNSIYKKGR